MSRVARDGTVIGDDMYAAMTSLTGQDYRVAVVSGSGGEMCANCGGTGWLFVDTLEGAYQFPPGGERPATWHEGKWRTYLRSGFACPVCGVESREQRLGLLMQASGLRGEEREYETNYVEGMGGKDKALEAARAILAGTPTPTGWLLLHGDYGVGKSGLLKSMTAALCRAGVAARYVTALEILAEIKATFNASDRNETEQGIVRRYGRLQFLAVDELDRIKETQWALSILFALFDSRYRDRGIVATALATNRTPAQLRDDTWSYLENRTRDGLRVEMLGIVLRGATK